MRRLLLSCSIIMVNALLCSFKENFGHQMCDFILEDLNETASRILHNLLTCQSERQFAYHLFSAGKSIVIKNRRVSQAAYTFSQQDLQPTVSPAKPKKSKRKIFFKGLGKGIGKGVVHGFAHGGHEVGGGGSCDDSGGGCDGGGCGDGGDGGGGGGCGGGGCSGGG